MEIDLFATDFPGMELIEAARAEVSDEEMTELIEEMAAFCPGLRALSRLQSSLFLCSAL